MANYLATFTIRYARVGNVSPMYVIDFNDKKGVGVYSTIEAVVNCMGTMFTKKEVTEACKTARLNDRATLTKVMEIN